MVDAIFILILILMLVQAAFSIYLSLYIWEDPRRISESASPTDFDPPKHSFTVLLPARHEEQVIGETIRSISKADYPDDLIEILVICDDSDLGTVFAANSAISKYGIPNARVITYGELPINKPHGLNTGLSYASKDIVVIFDAEDEVSSSIFNVANTIYNKGEADILQAGVQLMNYDSHWFSSHNVLEYFFWFKSRMHFHTKVGMVPLGGNTVFFKRIQLLAAGGWDNNCLTEDAEIGIRMSSAGAKVVSTYDPSHVTREETPATIGQFLKQRTRWNQGFIQVLQLGHWKNYDSTFKRWFCFYTLAFPLFQAVLTLVTPVILIFGLETKLPMLIALFSVVPLLILAAQIFIGWVALYEFMIEQGLKVRWTIFPVMALTFVPYQTLLGIGALRATYRHLQRRNEWEKTAHLGAHRRVELESSISTETAV